MLMESAYALENVVGVCDAVHGKASGSIKIRGLGRVGKEGFVLFDHTCPVASTFDPPIPASILLDTPARPSQFRELVYSRSSDLYQLVVEGDIRCADGLKLEPSRPRGNGFGSYGNFACELKVAKVLVLKAWR